MVLARVRLPHPAVGRALACWLKAQSPRRHARTLPPEPVYPLTTSACSFSDDTCRGGELQTAMTAPADDTTRAHHGRTGGWMRARDGGQRRVVLGVLTLLLAMLPAGEAAKVKRRAVRTPPRDSDEPGADATVDGACERRSSVVAGLGFVAPGQSSTPKWR